MLPIRHMYIYIYIYYIRFCCCVGFLWGGLPPPRIDSCSKDTGTGTSLRASCTKPRSSQRGQGFNPAKSARDDHEKRQHTFLRMRNPGVRHPTCFLGPQADGEHEGQSTGLGLEKQGAKKHKDEDSAFEKSVGSKSKKQASHVQTANKSNQKTQGPRQT